MRINEDQESQERWNDLSTVHRKEACGHDNGACMRESFWCEAVMLQSCAEEQMMFWCI